MSEFERQLSADGYVVLKFFVHISKDVQKKRLKGLHDNPDTAWRVSDEELATVRDYDEIYARYDELLRNTDFDFARWTMVNGEDKRSENITIAKRSCVPWSARLRAVPMLPPKPPLRRLPPTVPALLIRPIRATARPKRPSA